MSNKQLSIYSRISSDILNLKTPPNRILKERDLANVYATSRTTIRQTLQKLANEEKIVITPRSKTIVSKINIQKIKESLLLRECLEETVASIILKKIKVNDLIYLSSNIEKQKKLLINYNKSKNKKYIVLDNQFHEYLFKIAGLKSFWKIISEHNFDFDRLRHLSASDESRAKQSTNEHLNIFLSIKEKKIKNLKNVIKKHFSNSNKHYKKIVKSYSSLIG